VKKSRYSGFAWRGSCDPLPGFKMSVGPERGLTVNRTILRIFLMLGLTAAILLEGYYILELRYRTEDQEEELRTISMQLQSLKNERDALRGELSLIKKAGENNNENTSEGKH
jgi:hypothetical protein